MRNGAGAFKTSEARFYRKEIIEYLSKSIEISYFGSLFWYSGVEEQNQCGNDFYLRRGHTKFLPEFES